jgi:aminotransferase
MNPALAAIEPSLIRALNARKRVGDIDLGLGEPRLRPDPAPFQRATEWVREHGCPYTPNAGFAELRAAIAGYLGIPGRGAEEVCVTVGSEEAIYLAIKSVVDPARHEVLVVEPCYLAYPKICTMEGVRHRAVALDPADGFAPRAAAVLQALRPDTRLIVLNSPANPTGRVWPATELESLGRALADRGGESVYVLSDEVYRELHYTPQPLPSLSAVYPHVLVAGSLSKSDALTGLRLGWLSGTPEVMPAAIKVHQFVNTAASTLSQRVALELFAAGGPGGHRPWYRETRGRLVAAMAATGLDWIPPEGAFYAMLRLPERLRSDSLAAAERLLEEERVVAVPGRAFGAAGEGWLRISWVLEPAELEEGIARIAAFLRRHG